jgi:hypothetical protein
MTRFCRFSAVFLTVLAGCLPLQTNLTESDLAQVPTSPIPPPVVQTALRAPLNTTPASQETAWRVDAVGRKLVEANPQIGLKPRFVATSSPDAEIVHRDLATVYVSEGLVRKCQSEAELATLLAGELGRMVRERESITPRETRAPERRPPIALPIGSPGDAWGADPAYFMELAKYEKENPRAAKKKPLPAPDPEHVARLILDRAGITPAEFGAAPATPPPSTAWRPQ